MYIAPQDGADETNISYSLVESTAKKTEMVTYNELLREVDLLELTSEPNLDDYTLRQLMHAYCNY